MKLPRFLRTKNGVFRVYLVALVAAFSALYVFLFASIRARLRSVENRADEAVVLCDSVRKLCSDLRAEGEKLASMCAGMHAGGTVRNADSGAPVSGVPDRARPNVSEEDTDSAPPVLLGSGQNGRYAYADVRYSDGTVLRHYQRLPEQLRRK